MSKGRESAVDHGRAEIRRRPGGRSTGSVVVLMAVMVASGLGRAHAQAAATTTTTTTPTATTTPTTAPGPADQPPPAPITPPSPPSGGPEHDSLIEPVPTEPVVVPPRPGPARPATPEGERAAQAALAERQLAFDGNLGARNAAAARYETLRRQTVDLEARLAALEADRQQQEERLDGARSRLKRLAVARYVATPVAPLNTTLEAPSFVDLSRRVAMLEAVVRADEGRVADYRAAARDATGEVERLAEGLAQSRGALAAAAAALQQADAGMVVSTAQMVSGSTGGVLVAGAMTFPVAGRHSFTDTFGAPRMFGTAFAHLHQGTDVFASEGTPLVAIERGVLVRVGSDVLGGTKLWLVGASGTRYFYAHLSAFALGVVEGKVVEAGEVVGFVGNTGNARGTSPHLHFEAHPDGAGPMNPYPLLRMIDEAQRLAPSPLPPGLAGR